MDDPIKMIERVFSGPNPGKPDLLTNVKCIHCGVVGARDWSDIVPGAIVCDSCPLAKPVMDPEWKYPDLVAETQLEPGIFVRTCALDRVSKYGWHYYTFAIATKSSQMKEVQRYKTRAEAESAHQECVNFVIARRADMRRARGSGQSARGRR